MLLLAWLAYFAFGIVLAALAPMVGLVSTDLHLTLTEMGTILGSWQLMYIIVSLFVGLASDRIGNRLVIGIGTTIIAASAILRSFATGYVTLLLGVAIFGIGGPALSIGLTKFVAQWFGTASRGRATGLYQMGSNTGVVFGLASVNSLFLPWLGSWRTVYLLLGAVSALISLAWWTLGRNPPAASPHGGEHESISRMLGSIKIRNAWVIAVVGISSYLMIHGLTNWLPTIAERTGVSAVDAGYYASIPSIVAIPSSLFLPFFVPLGRRKITSSLLLALGAASAGLIGVSSGSMLVLVLAVQGIAQGALQPLFLLMYMDTPEIGTEHIGTVSGLYFAIGEIGGFVGPSALGFSADVTGSFVPGLIVIVVYSAAAIVPLYALVRERSSRGHSIKN